MNRVIFAVFFIFTVITISAQQPAFLWAKHIGGNSYTYGQSIVVDSNGNQYIAGYFRNSSDFDPGPIVYGLTASSPSGDLFIVKLNTNGGFIWAKNISTNQTLDPSMSDVGYSLSIDKKGNVYVTGSFRLTTDFDPNSGMFNLTSNGGLDIFILKLNSDGHFVWAKQIGGSLNDKGVSITINNKSQIITTGSFQDTVDFNPGVGINNFMCFSNNDAFILKLDTIGNYVWAKQFVNSVSGSLGWNSVTTDSMSNIFSTGYFFGLVDFDPGIGTYNLSGNFDIFISKLDSMGNFLWAKTFGDIGWYDEGKSIEVDHSGNVYATGYFSGVVDFDPSPTSTFTLHSTNSDVFIIKLDPLGNFYWAKNMGLNSDAIGHDLTLDLQGNVYITGQFTGISNFDPSVSNFTLSSNGSTDIFISKLDFAGNFVWAKSIGSSIDDVGHSIAIDGSNNIYTTGWYRDIVDFDPGEGVFNIPTAGYYDMFIHKMSQPALGIEENNFNNNITVYPNPTTETINIDIDNKLDKNSYFEILNVLGEIKISKPILNQYSIFNIEQLKNGLYFVKIICNDKNVFTKKIVKN